jgi:methanogenic corrinoid protein MtbC1
LTHGVAPFLKQIGEEWAQGTLSVAHEHFASERLRDFLTRLWRPLSEKDGGRPLVFASLPGEHHHLGLHMAASVAALHDQAIIFLGMDTPLQAIATACDQVNARAVMVSVSAAMQMPIARENLRALKGLISENTQMVVGGEVNGLDVADIAHLTDLKGLEHWLLDPANA